jgi:hypothetical protein
MREPHMRLSEMSACSSSVSHRLRGRVQSVLLNPAMKWFLNVHIARSAALCGWICGGVSWLSMLLSFVKSCSALEASLSIFVISA